MTYVESQPVSSEELEQLEDLYSFEVSGQGQAIFDDTLQRGREVGQAIAGNTKKMAATGTIAIAVATGAPMMMSPTPVSAEMVHIEDADVTKAGDQVLVTRKDGSEIETTLVEGLYISDLAELNHTTTEAIVEDTNREVAERQAAATAQAPAPEAPAPATPKSEAFQYTPKAGDYPAKVVQMAGHEPTRANIQEFMADNGIPSENLMMAGKPVTVDLGGSAPAPETKVTHDTTKPGDIPARVLERNGVTATPEHVAEFLQDNGIPNERLMPSNKSVIIDIGGNNTASETSTTYTVLPGDVLIKVSQRFGVSSDAIAQANGITNPNLIMPNQKLVIPGVDGPTAPTPAPEAKVLGATIDAAPETPSAIATAPEAVISGAELSRNIPEHLRSTFEAVADKYGLNPNHVPALYSTENGNIWRDKDSAWASSPVGASGPFQFMPATWEALKQDGNGDGIKDINNFEDAADTAGYLLSNEFGLDEDTPLGTLDKPFEEDTFLEAAAWYNWGSGNAAKYTNPDSPITAAPEETQNYQKNIYTLITSDFTESGIDNYGDPRLPDGSPVTPVESLAEVVEQEEVAAVVEEEVLQAEVAAEEFPQPVGNLTESSVDVPCAPGTDDLGVQQGYNRGTPIDIRVCGIPTIASTASESQPHNTFSIEGANGNLVVNSRISGTMLALGQMAIDDGVTQSAKSGFRSNQHQIQLWYDNGQNPIYVASPGYSDHQLGLAVDFANMNVKGGTTCGSRAQEPGNYYWEWVNHHAPVFGMRPINSESWHWTAQDKVLCP